MATKRPKDVRKNPQSPSAVVRAARWGRRRAEAALQEALHNVVKHSASPVAQVPLSHAREVLRLRITDSGRGFSLRSTESGLGLVSLRERVHFVGGQIALHSMPGQGTRLDVRGPVSRDGMFVAVAGIGRDRHRAASGTSAEA